MIKDLGILKLRETDDSEVFYVTVQDTFIFATTKYPDYAKEVGKIEVHHDGMYFGTPEQMYEWIEGNVIAHLIDKGYIVEDGETMLGEKIWKWNI